MSQTPPDGRLMLEQLQAARSAADVIEILGDVSIVKQLSAYAKEPGVRKAVMLLANPDPAVDLQVRFRRLAFLASLSMVKAVRPIVDEYAPRALAEPLSEVASGLSHQEKFLLAGWLSGRKMAWISDFAARMAVVESTDEKVCQTYLVLFVSRAPDISYVIQRLTDTVELLGKPSEPASALGKRNLCMAVARLVAKTSVPAGKHLSNLLRNFVVQEILKGGEGYQIAEKTGIALSVSELLSVLVQRFQGILLSDTPFEIVSALEKEWISPADRKWKQWRTGFFRQVEEVTTLFALNGICATELVRKAKVLETVAGAIEKMCRKILEQNSIVSEEVANWLALGGNANSAKTTRPRESLSESEALAQVLLRADELASVNPRQDPDAELAVRETLLEEVNQFVTRKGLKLDSKRNSIVPYDPMRQRSTGAIPPSGRVRVLSPGVVRMSDTGLLQVVQAIVEASEQ